MNPASPSAVTLAMRAIAAGAVVALLGSCGSGPGADRCSSVAGEAFDLVETHVAGPCSGSPETVTFQPDGGDSAGRGWSQSGCRVTLDAGTFIYELERDGGELAGTITSICSPADALPDGGCASAACLIDVTGTHGGP